MASVITPDDIDFRQYMHESDPRAKMRPASAYRDVVKKRFAMGFQQMGAQAPWAKTADKIRFREGETTVWAGVNGHGKSMVLGQVMMGFMQQQLRCAIASFEMKPVVTLHRMCRQASCGEFPTEAFIDSFHDWTENLLWLYDHQGQIDVPHMLAVCRFAHRELKIKHLVIDSIMKVVRKADDYNAQKDFVDAITTIGRDSGMHMHLVHHMKKGDGSNKPGSKDDIKGAGEIMDQVDNGIIIWRNKGKESKKQANVVDEEAMRPDSLMIVEKQRNGEWEGRVNLWFDRESQQYLAAENDQPQEYVSRLNRRAA